MICPKHSQLPRLQAPELEQTKQVVGLAQCLSVTDVLGQVEGSIKVCAVRKYVWMQITGKGTHSQMRDDQRVESNC